MAAEPFHTLKEHLLRLGYQVSCFETAAEAADHLVSSISGQLALADR